MNRVRLGVFCFKGRERPSWLLFMDLATRVNNVNSGAFPLATVYVYLGWL